MRHLTDQQEAELIADVQKFTISLIKESERAVVIIAAARLDSDLETLLKNLLIPHPGGNDPLFDNDKPLGTFSAKIAMAYRLGAIDNDFEHALQMVRKIRNDFAHQIDTESLSTPAQKSRLAILVRWAEHSSIFRKGFELLAADPKLQGTRSNEHTQLVFCVVVMVVMLHAGLLKLKRVNVGTALCVSQANVANSTI